jgi:hypothetical protein
MFVDDQRKGTLRHLVAVALPVAESACRTYAELLLSRIFAREHGTAFISLIDARRAAEFK